MSDKNLVFLSDVRLSFPHLIEPQVNKDGKSSYNAEFIMPQTHPGFQAFMVKVNELAVEKWKEHASAVIHVVNTERKSRCYGNGSEKINKKTYQPYDGYVNNVFITAGKNQMPQVIQADGNPIDPNNTMLYKELTRKMYGGCRVNVALKPWLQDNEHGRAVRCELIAIQFVRDDEPFGEGAVDASGMFGAVVPGAQQAPGAAPAFGMPPAQMPPAPFGAPAPAAPAFMAPAAPAMPPAPFQQPPTAPGVPSFLR